MSTASIVVRKSDVKKCQERLCVLGDVRLSRLEGGGDEVVFFEVTHPRGLFEQIEKIVTHLWKEEP